MNETGERETESNATTVWGETADGRLVLYEPGNADAWMVADAGTDLEP